MADIIVFAEIDDGVINDISLQCMAKARELARHTGGAVKCLAAGSGVGNAAADLFAYGADEVYTADDERLSSYITCPYCRVVCDFLRGQHARAALFPSSTLGGDLAASVASCMKAGAALDCDQLNIENDTLTARRMEFDRKVLTSYAPAGDCMICALRDGAAEAPAKDDSKTGSATALEVVLDEADRVSRVLKRDVAKKTVNLKDAKIIVSGGAGVGTKENFELIRQLADKLGAEVGATRAVVDAGWLPADHQIGQTGATVRPDLYIACGISGAVQHRVGMMDARKIVAINIDASAPIFRIAHYKVVGDLTAVLPKMIKLL